MDRIRKDNDFQVLWDVLRRGVPFDITNALDLTVNVQMGYRTCSDIVTKTLPAENISHPVGSTNQLLLDIDADFASELGPYRFVLSFRILDATAVDGSRMYTVDVVPLTVVPTTSEAEDITTITANSDVIIGFKGDKGEDGLDAYEVWLIDNPTGTLLDYYNWQRQPATDAATEVQSQVNQFIEDKEIEIDGILNPIQQAEQNRVTAEGERALAEDAREEAEEVRTQTVATLVQNATTAINNKIGEANEAINDANLATQSANDAAGLADTAAQAANTAAELADDARLAIQTDLGLKANHGYTENPKSVKQVEDELTGDLLQLAGEVSDSTEKAGAASLAELNARLLALEKIVSATITHKLEVTKEFNVWGRTNLILTGSGAATFAPDFVGQKYIDTTGGNVYVAVGVGTAGNWKLV